MAESEIGRIFSSLIHEIRKLEKTRKLSIEEDELLNRAIQWLKNHQHPEGYWGYESVADTGLVLLALATYGIKERKWVIKGKYGGGIQKSVQWLKDALNVDNWGKNLWDTSICLQALLRLGVTEDWIVRVIQWVRKECKENPEKYPIHHLAQAVNALVEAGFPEDAYNVCKFIANKEEELMKKGQVLDLYVAGQVLDALTRAKFDLTSSIITNLETNLRKSLERIGNEGISEASFQDVTMAFMGLASFLGGEDNPLINSITAELFKTPERFKYDGSWYHDAKKTAFALIGISKIKDIRKVNEFPNRIYRIITRYQREVVKIFDSFKEREMKRISVVKKGYFWISVVYCSIIASLLISLIFGINDSMCQLIISTLLVPISLSAAVKAYFSYKGRLNEQG